MVQNEGDQRVAGRRHEAWLLGHDFGWRSLQKQKALSACRRGKHPRRRRDARGQPRQQQRIKAQAILSHLAK